MARYTRRVRKTNKHIHSYTHIHTHTYIYIYIYIYIYGNPTFSNVSTRQTRSYDFWIVNAMCTFVNLFAVYFSFAPVISASIQPYENYFDIQVLMIVTETEMLTSTLHHNKFTYLDYVFLLPSYIYIYIYIYVCVCVCVRCLNIHVTAINTANFDVESIFLADLIVVYNNNY